jgi:hypothetical protein
MKKVRLIANYIVFEWKIDSKADMLGQFTAEQSELFEQVRGAWIVKSWIWPECSIETAEELPAGVQPEVVEVLNVQWWYVTKVATTGFIAGGKLYLTRGVFVGLTMLGLSSKPHAIWMNPEGEQRAHQHAKQFLAAITHN